MKFLFVRHGDTVVSADDFVQPVDNQLTEGGKKQAKAVAEKLIDYHVDLIVTSPMPRTKDTAKIINQVLNKKLTENQLLVEVKWPSVLEGLKTDDPRVIEYRKLRNEKNIDDPSWHYADEENFIDLKKRAKKLLDELKAIEGNNILVVTHSTFMKVIVTVMCHGDDVLWPVYYDFLKFTKPRHTAISTFDFDTKGQWHLESWNI